MLAQQQDKYSILRSLNPRNGSHGVADAYMLTGHPFNPALTYPAYGSVVAREKGDQRSMPPYVQVGTAIDQRFGGGIAGFLGDQYNPFVLPGDASSPGFTVRDVTPARMGWTRGRFQRRMKVLETVDTWQAQMESSQSALEAADTFYKKAYSLITAPHAKKAFDIGAEDPRLRDRYGRHSLGQGCLLARRLIESGVRFVTVTDGGWDTHTNNFTSLKTRLLPRLDTAVSALLQDLSDRGQLESTLVVVLERLRPDAEGQPLGGPRPLGHGGDRAAGRRRDSPRDRRGTNQRAGRTADRGPVLHRRPRRDDLPLPGHPARHHAPHPRRPARAGQLRREARPRIGLMGRPSAVFRALAIGFAGPV